jgi:pimeloyl-ACP methyl ester carboxylesterase
MNLYRCIAFNFISMKPSASEHRSSVCDGHLLQVSRRTKLSANNGIMDVLQITDSKQFNAFMFFSKLNSHRGLTKLTACRASSKILFATHPQVPVRRSIKAAPGEIDRIVFLGAAPNLPADKLKSRALFIVARDDRNDAGPRLPGIREQYEKAPQPKELIVLDGSAHAQFLFQTDQSAHVMRDILRFLSIP